MPEVSPILTGRTLFSGLLPNTVSITVTIETFILAPLEYFNGDSAHRSTYTRLIWRAWRCTQTLDRELNQARLLRPSRPVRSAYCPSRRLGCLSGQEAFLSFRSP